MTASSNSPGKPDLLPDTLDIREDDSKIESTQEEPSAFNAFLRVFSFGTLSLYFLQVLGVITAIASGVGLAMVNVVLGQFINLMGAISTSDPSQESFMGAVRTTALYFVYIGITRLVCTYLYSSLFTYVSHRLVRDIQRSYMCAAFGQEIGYYDRGLVGSISMQATSNGKLIQAGISEKLGLFVQTLSTFVAAFVIAFVTQWKLTLIILCIVPTLLILVGTVSAFDALINADLFKVYGQAGTYTENIFSGIRTIHAFSLRQRVVAKYETFLKNAYTRGMRKNKLMGILFGGQYFVIYCGMGLTFWQGFAMMDHGEISELGTVFTVLFSVIIAATTLTSLAPHVVVFGRAATAALELFNLIDRKSEINSFGDSGHKPSCVDGIVDIKGVTFSYPTRPDVTVLDNFTLHIPGGKVTALVGPSGSGKSTIIGLLERWYNPDAGSISLDGKEIKELNLTWLRTNLRLVQQEPVLFNGSVFDNIANGLLGTPWEHASNEERSNLVQEAARSAFAHDFIVNLPSGYDTRIGERGGLLSGGQRQRIAIARSIISNPRILLLDEATSALDPTAESLVQQALDHVSQNRTTIVIAHKLSTVRNADNIVVVSKGRISEQGTHGQLMAKNGIYCSLVKAQDLSPPGGMVSESEISNESSANMANNNECSHSLKELHSGREKEITVLEDSKNHENYEKSSIVSSILSLARSTPQLRPWYIVSICACIGGAALYPGQTLLLGRIVDLLGDDNKGPKANFISLMFFIMAIGCLGVYFAMGWAMNVIAQTMSTKLRKEIFDSILRQDLCFFDRAENTVGALTSRLDLFPQAILELMGINISFVLVSVISVLACSILSFVISWKVAVVGVLVGVPPLMFAGWARIRLETKMGADMSKAFSQSASIASESIMAIRTVSSLAIENNILQRYTKELDHAIGQCTPIVFHMMIWFSFTQCMEHFVIALGFWWGSKLVAEGEINFYQFMVAFMGVYFSATAAGILFSFAGSFTSANEAANYYFWLQELQPIIKETKENHDKGPDSGCSSYHWNDVQFSYPLAPERRVLKGVSMNIERGEFVAFVGASGCGKSTMISLLERFYDPVSGRIHVDSAPLVSMNPTMYRQHIALVQQEPTLFPGSIRENISQGMTSGSASDEDIEEACRAANIWDFVTSLPEGLNTLCGTSGSQLSGGQRQRIAIARALVRKPSVLLLDEATSALDSDSERVVQAALMNAATGERITIAVAHRLSTVRRADRIFVFHEGRVVEAGTHDELVQKNGIYAKMCEL